MHSKEITEGQVVAGKYRIDRVLGEGGMGVVVAAHHLELDERVALKFLLPQALANGEAVARFEREARAAVRIKSEHVVRVTDVGKLPSGSPYIVMEYLDGQDLSCRLRQHGALPLEQAVEFVLQACVAVADAHSVGIVHRDLKPANLFCVRRSDGQLLIKVLDFGISKLKDPSSLGGSRDDVSVTVTSAVMGSPLYMSPEQVQSSRDVDARTDVWALGVVLFELVTGSAPFLGQSFGEVAIKIATQELPSVTVYRPDLPQARELDAVLRKCLEKLRDRRYTNVAEFAQALLPFAPKGGRALVQRIAGILQAAGLSESALAVPSTPQVVPTMLAGHAPGVGKSPTALQTDAPWSATHWPRPRRKVLLGGGVLLAVAALVGATLFLSVSPEPPPAPTGSAAPSVFPNALGAEAVVPEVGTAPAGGPSAAEGLKIEPPEAPKVQADSERVSVRPVPPAAGARNPVRVPAAPRAAPLAPSARSRSQPPRSGVLDNAAGI